MNTDEEITIRYIQGHKSLDFFDYSIAVDWAIDLIRQGKDNDNVLMLASFTKPIDRFEISPYVSNVLRDFGLAELEQKDALLAKSHYCLNEILNDRDIRKNVRILYEMCQDNNYEGSLMPFYLMFWALEDLDSGYMNYHYEGVTLFNFEEIAKKDARKWIDEYIYGIVNEDADEDNKLRSENEYMHKNTNTIFNYILQCLGIFILGILFAIYFENDYRILVRHSYKLFNGEQILFIGKNFHISASYLFADSFGLFATLAFLMLKFSARKKRFTRVCLSIFVFFVATFLVSALDSKRLILECTNCNGIKRISYNEVSYDQYFVISLGFAFLYLLSAFLLERKRLRKQNSI